MACESFVSQSPQFPLLNSPAGIDSTELVFMKLMMEMLKAFSNLVAEASGSEGKH